MQKENGHNHFVSENVNQDRRWFPDWTKRPGCQLTWLRTWIAPPPDFQGRCGPVQELSLLNLGYRYSEGLGGGTRHICSLVISIGHDDCALIVSESNRMPAHNAAYELLWRIAILHDHYTPARGRTRPQSCCPTSG